MAVNPSASSTEPAGVVESGRFATKNTFLSRHSNNVGVQIIKNYQLA